MPGKENSTLLELNEVSKWYPVSGDSFFRKNRGRLKAVDRVSFRIQKGETLGLVGESGCGKTTTGRLILNLETATRGSIVFDGKEITRLPKKEKRALKKQMQVIFQDPFGSLNPRMTAAEIIGQPLRIHKMAANRSEYRQRIDHLMEMVGLQPGMADRYPHEFSGGQRQRIGIARAISVNPRFLVCDEPVSALDVSIQAQIVNLLERLQRELGLTCLFIAHDLAVVRHISDRIAVMYLGGIVEMADRNDLYAHPQHPYTQALLSAVPIPDPEAEAGRDYVVLAGEVPSLLDPPPGCKFHPRCPRAIAACREAAPALSQKGNRHWVACHAI